MNQRPGSQFFVTAATVLFVVALPVFLVTSNVRFLASDVAFYERGFREHDSVERTGLAIEELDRAAAQIAGYFSNDARTLRIVVIEDAEEVPLFTAREAQHMEDVKSLMRVVYRINEVSLAIVLVYVSATLLWASESSPRRLAKQALAGVGVGVAFVGIVGAFALLGFDSTWRTFHEIAFRNDLWQLDPETDRLIQMFPESFWAEATFVVAGLTVLEFAAVVIASTATLLFARGAKSAGGDLRATAPSREPQDIAVP